MNFQITYLKNKVVQTKQVIEQSIYERYRYVKSLVPEQGDVPKEEWKNLNKDERKKMISELYDFKWLVNLDKKSSFVVKGSPIHEAFERGDGKLILSSIQGGIHEVEIKEVL